MFNKIQVLWKKFTQRKIIFAIIMIMIGTCCAQVKPINIIDMLKEPTSDDDAVPDPDIYKPYDGKYKIPRINISQSINLISVIIWLAAIKEAEKAGSTTVLLDINSTGGSLEEGFKLAKAIEETPMQVICIVDGTAASEAFYILQSCDKRLMTKRSELMVHEPYFPTGTTLSRKHMKELTNELDASVFGWIEHAGHRMKIGPKGIRQKVKDSDWWLCYREALKEGAVDGVVLSVPSVWKQLMDGKTIDVINKL